MSETLNKILELYKQIRDITNILVENRDASTLRSLLADREKILKEISSLEQKSLSEVMDEGLKKEIRDTILEIVSNDTFIKNQIKEEQVVIQSELGNSLKKQAAINTYRLHSSS